MNSKEVSQITDRGLSNWKKNSSKKRTNSLEEWLQALKTRIKRAIIDELRTCQVLPKKALKAGDQEVWGGTVPQEPMKAM